LLKSKRHHARRQNPLGRQRLDEQTTPSAVFPTAVIWGKKKSFFLSIFFFGSPLSVYVFLCTEELFCTGLEALKYRLLEIEARNIIKF
jgi:hypothetical protein